MFSKYAANPVDAQQIIDEIVECPEDYLPNLLGWNDEKHYYRSVITNRNSDRGGCYAMKELLDEPLKYFLYGYTFKKSGLSENLIKRHSRYYQGFVEELSINRELLQIIFPKGIPQTEKHAITWTYYMGFLSLKVFGERTQEWDYMTTEEIMEKLNNE